MEHFDPHSRMRGSKIKNVLILPAHNEGFEKVFIGENQWYAFKAATQLYPNLKYLALYRAAPISGITHYAEILSINKYDNMGRKIAILKGIPIELPHVIVLGEIKGGSLRSPRYTTLDKLLSAKEIKDLL